MYGHSWLQVTVSECHSHAKGVLNANRVAAHSSMRIAWPRIIVPNRQQTLKFVALIIGSDGALLMGTGLSVSTT